MDEMRRAALDERTALLEATRAEADRAVADARAELARDVDKARAALDADAASLADEAANRILGRHAS
jgi:F0F1-type ATP synthase membrane subunit b/b'